MNNMFTPRLVKNQSSGSEVGCRGKQHDDLVLQRFLIFVKKAGYRNGRSHVLFLYS